MRMPRQKIVVNLAPADIRKEGSAYDLPIAMGILAASKQLEAAALGDFLMLGELSLDGGVQPIKGALTVEIGRAACRERGWKCVWISVVAGSLKKKTKKY